MSTLGAIPPNQPDNATASSRLMPNRAYSRIWRLVGAVFLLFGIAAAGAALSGFFAQLEARRHWSRADGVIAAATQKWADENKSPGGSPSISATRTMYWVAYEVDFRPSDGCRTGTSFAGEAKQQFPCVVYLHSIPSRFPSAMQAALLRHRQGSFVQVLYDPNGPGLKFADDSLLEVINWNRLIPSLIFVILGLFLISAAQRRLRELAYLPAGDDLPAPPSSTISSANPDELINLKLS